MSKKVLSMIYFTIDKSTKDIQQEKEISNSSIVYIL